MNKTFKQIQKILDENNFNCYNIEEQDGEYIIEFQQYTPCGEDWNEYLYFDGTINGFEKALHERWYYFDIDDEVEIWIPLRGKNGVPESITALFKDAEWKKDTLEELLQSVIKLIDEKIKK